MAEVTLSMEEYQALLAGLPVNYAANLRQADEIMARYAEDVPKPTKKRKVSRYNREFGRQLKRLKAKHPKTQSKNLMKRAHALTKKALKS